MRWPFGRPLVGAFNLFWLILFVIYIIIAVVNNSANKKIDAYNADIRSLIVLFLPNFGPMKSLSRCPMRHDLSFVGPFLRGRDLGDFRWRLDGFSFRECAIIPS